MNKKGYSVTEILVVVAILVGLGYLALSMYSRAISVEVKVGIVIGKLLPPVKDYYNARADILEGVHKKKSMEVYVPRKLAEKYNLFDSATPQSFYLRVKRAPLEIYLAASRNSQRSPDLKPKVYVLSMRKAPD